MSCESAPSASPSVFVAGARSKPALAHIAMEAIRERGWKTHDWLALDEMRIRGELSDADCLKANHRALDECDAVLLIEPARTNGRAEAAYAAGADKPVAIYWASGQEIPAHLDQLWELLGMDHNASPVLVACLDWLEEALA